MIVGRGRPAILANPSSSDPIMPRSGAATVDEYLAELPEDRRAAIAEVRDVVLRNLPAG